MYLNSITVIPYIMFYFVVLLDILLYYSILYHITRYSIILLINNNILLYDLADKLNLILN